MAVSTPTPEDMPELTPEDITSASETMAEALEAFTYDGDRRDDLEYAHTSGEPLERNYAPSCLGGGEDGELVYEGFTVYTYREGDRETVTDVS